MKKWSLLWIFYVVSLEALGLPYTAHFPNAGNVKINETSSGLVTDIFLQADPGEKYMIKFLPLCNNVKSYWSQFRHSFEIRLVANKWGIVQRSVHFPGTYNRDLSIRELNTMVLYRLEKSHWKMLNCVALEEINSDPLNPSLDQKPF